MIEFVAFGIFIFLFFVLIINNIRFSLKLSSASQKLIQAHIDNTILAEKLFETSARIIVKKETDSDAFLKFVSDSRDWAYQYIDEVQEGLNKFITDIQPEIAYFDEYGEVGSAYPHYHSMKKISGAYKELKKLLPEDYDRIE
ncbi:MAG: hypothetical protein AN484_00980 [Aphanizomenon flos-aquae WA102]|uniref:Uncharacterized protein n=1 Tax=Aphanizomenon flos-aquae WA102 TaxID=1710896 RepID=A0A1B7X887_APHFL|nr:MAG: hypothetical protein AN484_00980 [Aphanizomenon flos-aquae WA102]